MLSPEAYEQQLAFVQAALPNLDAEHCRHVFYEVVRRDIRKALHELLRPEAPLETLLEQWPTLPVEDSAARRTCLTAMLGHFCPNAAYQAAVRRAVEADLEPLEPRVMDRLRQYKRAPRLKVFQQWWAHIHPEDEALTQYFLEELRYFTFSLEPFWANIDGYLLHPNKDISNAAIQLLVGIPEGVKRSLKTIRILMEDPKRQVHALQALQHVKGLAERTTRSIIQPTVLAYQALRREVGEPNDLSAEYGLARNIARNNGISLTLTDLNIGRS